MKQRKENRETPLSNTETTDPNRSNVIHPEPTNVYKKSLFSYEELIACGKGDLFGPGRARLPLPPMLMFDRITQINVDGGPRKKGYVSAELDIKKDLWFFGCHFLDDPVMPGCLELDAMWQLVGFFLAWRGYKGFGRALGTGAVQFTGQTTPKIEKVTYEIEFKAVINRGMVLGSADGRLSADGKVFCKATDMRVGLFSRETLDTRM